MAKLIVSEELPSGAKTEDIVRALKGRLWGEDTERARLLFFDMEHAVTDARILAANENYAVAEVNNHRDRRAIHWLVGRTADREDMLFIHPLRGPMPQEAIRPDTGAVDPDLFLRFLNRVHEGFSRRIQGDIVMALGATRDPDAGLTKEERQQRGSIAERLEFVCGMHAGPIDHVWTNYNGRENRSMIDWRLGSSWAGHRISCPAGVVAGDWRIMSTSVPVLLCRGTFDIAHHEHEAITVEVPHNFTAALSIQQDGESHMAPSLAIGATGPQTAFD